MHFVQNKRREAICLAMWEWSRVCAVEEGVERNLQGGPASLTSSPEVPQQTSVRHCGAPKAIPLSQKQQRPLAPGNREGPCGGHTRVSAFWGERGWGIWSIRYRDSSRLPRGVGTLRLRVSSAPCLVTFVHIQNYWRNKSSFSLLHTLVPMNLELEVTPTYHVHFYVWYQTRLRLSRMEFKDVQCWVADCPKHCRILSLVTADCVFALYYWGMGEPQCFLCTLHNWLLVLGLKVEDISALGPSSGSCTHVTALPLTSLFRGPLGQVGMMDTYSPSVWIN